MTLPPCRSSVSPAKQFRADEKRRHADECGEDAPADCRAGCRTGVPKIRSFRTACAISVSIPDPSASFNRFLHSQMQHFGQMESAPIGGLSKLFAAAEPVG
jgi:hypothetical protein